MISLNFRIVSLMTASMLLSVSAPLFPTGYPRFFINSATAQTTPDHSTEAKRLLEQGIQQHKNNQHEAALQSFQEALKIFQQSQNRKSTALTLALLGDVYSSLEQPAQALQSLKQSLEIYRQLGDRQGEAIALNDLGNAYNTAGQYQPAINTLKQAFELRGKLGDLDGQATSGGNLASAFNNVGQYNLALEYLTKAVAIQQKLGNRRKEAIFLNNLGNTHLNLKQYAKAINLYQKSFKISQQLDDRLSQSNALNNLGNAYFKNKQNAQAIQVLQQALVIQRQIGNWQGQAATLGNLGNAYDALQQYPQAIKLLQESVKIAHERSLTKHEAVSLQDLGLTLFHAGKLSEAEKSLFKAIEVSESLRTGLNDANKVSIIDTQKNVYLNLQRVLAAENKTDQALEVSERGRARAFVELLEKRVSESEGATNQTNTNLEAINISLSQIQQIAKAENATLVEYSIIYRQKLFIWVIQPSGKVTFRSVDLKSLKISLADLVNNSRQEIDVDIPDGKVKVAKPLQKLHQLLIQPIADLLPKDSNQRIIFIPQDSLFLVPFPALQAKNGKFLIESHTISTAPSIQVLALTQKQRQLLPCRGNEQTCGQALVVGNPKMPKGTPQLPGAEIEAKAIAPLLNTQAIVGAQATEGAIVQKMLQARFIHLATHGGFNSENGLSSLVVLTPSGKDDGYLTAREILKLKLNAELVVLSACNTGRGKITGDGVIGLSRSLISAGVPSTVVSLWSVPDAPTAFLMYQFYQNLQKTPDKAQALRQAMLATMKKSSLPRNWAAFTLIGETQ
ncbi:TPR repeat-containing protein (plasmid) [Nostoc sp. HK-01]|nr:TPR repeat-containing protein [Nostoc sp. HK-01]